MAEINLTATPRSLHGTRPARRLRAEGKIPAVVYGRGGDPVPVTVVWRDLRAALTTDQGLNAVIHLDVEGTVAPTLVKDIQRHPVRRDVLHVDFLRVDLDKPVEVDVSIVLEGEPTAVLQTEGGVVDHVMQALTISAKPDQIPPQIVVNVDDLQVGDTIRVSDLSLPSGVETHVDPDEAVVVTHISIAEVPEPEVEEAEEAAEGEAAEGEGEGGEAAGGEAAGGEGGGDTEG